MVWPPAAVKRMGVTAALEQEERQHRGNRQDVPLGERELGDPQREQHDHRPDGAENPNVDDAGEDAAEMLAPWIPSVLSTAANVPRAVNRRHAFGRPQGSSSSAGHANGDAPGPPCAPTARARHAGGVTSGA